MRRYNYGQNFTAQQSSRFGVLTPLGYLETAPGDTISGKFTTNLWTDTTHRPVMNRVYYDTFAFYVPFRLLWDGFPDFIKNEEDTSTVPLVQNLSGFFFEKTFDSTVDNCTAWYRRAYNLIWDKYFRLNVNPSTWEANPDNAFFQQVAQRETTWHESGLPDGTLTDESVAINVVGETVSIDALRQGFATDRIRKIRQLYGDKYSDYLNTMGIKTPWTILDEPEFLGKMSKDFQYSNTNTTFSAETPAGEGQNTGDSAGYFKQKIVQPIRPTFCPEHGLIVMLGAARMDFPNTQGNVPVVCAKQRRDQYYNPEFETKRYDTWPLKMWGDNASPAALPGQQRVYEDYRKPGNMLAQFQNLSNPDLLYMTTRTDGSTDALGNTKLIPEEDYDKIFVGSMGGATFDVHYSAYIEHRLMRKSPVRPPAQIGGVA